MQSNSCRNQYSEVAHSERIARFCNPIVDCFRTGYRITRPQSTHHYGNDANNDQHSASILCGELRFIFDVDVLFYVSSTRWFSAR